MATVFDLNVVYMLASATSLIVLLYKWVFAPKKQRTLPVWAPIEIALTSLIVSKGGLAQRIYTYVRRYDGSLFGLTWKHQVLVNLPSVDRLMSQSYHTLNAEPMQYTIFTRVFGGVDSAQLKTKLEKSWKDLLRPIEEMFLNDTASTVAIERGNAFEKAASLVTFSTDASQMKRWELSAGVKVITPDVPEISGAVEVNLQSLTRDFGACVAIPLLYGQDFMDRYSKLLDDFWRFDNEVFPLLMIGIPTWAPFKMMKEGVTARSRLLKEISGLYRRIDQYQRGEPVDFGADLSDISKVALERNKAYDRQGWTFEERGGGDLAILWGQNANTQPILFWLVTYIYSTPGLLGRLREETAPYITLSRNKPLEVESTDLPGLFSKCPLLKACIFETYRMANEATSIRYVARPVTIDDGTYKHEMRPGMFVSAPHSVIQRDPSVYPDPDQFIPDRFLATDAESGKTVARYGRLRPWGTGSAMCKGRTFAEKEIITLGTAIISLWDIGPADGAWKLPTMIPGTGVKKPIKDIRVVVSRRMLN
ncbi:putative cytochrome P450 [Polychaeton citri CBS 116435]|uniref:Cytochrome P450 n=1 Tax=Polychaeton citri CBS 116435 TaxID=1314669 RepID=A0A9P4Q6Q0_9PEZI|nr:putative cytochrome P450 [Polychaeton citri CBS 116435]